MRIPRKLRLMGQTINVRFVKDLVYQKDNVGEAFHRNNEILLQESTESWDYPQERSEQDFLHELVHHILNKLAEDELCRNEKFVDTFAGLLHQAITTMEYEQKEETIPINQTQKEQLQIVKDFLDRYEKWYGFDDNTKEAIYAEADSHFSHHPVAKI